MSFTQDEIEKYRVTYGKYDILLNPGMVDKMKIYQVEELKEVYIELFKIFEKMEIEGNRIKLYKLNQSIEPLELKMQECFGIKVDRNYHRYWCECPKCTCPKMDNIDVRGTDIRYHDSECIIHGEKTKLLIERQEKLNNINISEFIDKPFLLSAWREGDLIELDGRRFRLTSDGYEYGSKIVCDSEKGKIPYVDLIERAYLLENKFGRKNDL